MASIQDYEGFKITISARYTNWWSFHIEFSFKEKPLLNPEIVKNDFWADEYSNDPLLPKVEGALNCHEPDQRFVWNEWEDEAQVVISYHKPNSQAKDGLFVFSAFVSSFAFEGGDSNSMDQPAGLGLLIHERSILESFYCDLNNEMLPIYNKLPDDHKGEGLGSRPKQW